MKKLNYLVGQIINLIFYFAVDYEINCSEQQIATYSKSKGWKI